MNETIWQRLIADLTEAGVKQKEIAAHSGLTQPSVSDLASGDQKTVRYEAGEVIKALHLIHCGPQAAKRRESLVRG